MSKRLALCCLLFASTVDSQSSNPKDDELCKTTIAKTDGSYTCRPIDQCPAVLRAAEDFAEYPKICRFDGRTPIVCCPDVPGAKAAEKCGEYYSSTTRGGGTIDFGGCPRRTEKSAENRRVSIVGGTEAVNSEFPHMVILGFGELVTDVHWSCGGSLISDRYVLSAAHCSEMGTKGPVKWTLLGDSDLGTDNGGADPQIREIVQRVLHPNYNPSSVYNDIGLYRLKTPVRFNRFVFPVCINADRQLVAEKAVAVGWGRTGSASPTSNVLRKVSLDFVDQNECNSSYSALTGKRLAFGINPNSQICAGNIGGGGKDTCQNGK